jgi:hypothetical protein
MQIVRPGLGEVFPGMGAGVAADVVLLPVGPRAARVVRIQGAGVVAALVTEQLPEGSVPQTIPEWPTSWRKCPRSVR